MILPDRVLGSSGTSMIWRGLAIGPSVLATCSRSSRASASPSSGVSGTALARRLAAPALG